MSKVAVIGAGMMGSALCWPLSDRGHEVFLAGTPLDRAIIDSIRASGLHPTLKRTLPAGICAFLPEEIPAVVKNADWIINGVSSFGIPWFSATAGPLVRPNQPILSVSKGLEVLDDGSLITFPEAIQRRFSQMGIGKMRINAIAGPCTAHELAARRQTAVVFTGEDPATLAFLRDELSTDYYHIWTSTDVTGVEVCAALKNAYAAGVGLAMGMMEQSGPDGLAQMYNPQAALFAQGIHEMGVMLKVLNGGLDNLYWLPGPGDLFVTIFGGRTITLGKLLGKGIPYHEARQALAGVTLESVAIITRVAESLPRLEARRLANCEDFPLLLHLNDIINHSASVNIPWHKFFKQQ